MTNKQLFIQKLSSILKEKNNRIKIVMMGQETVEVFTKALKEPNASVPESVLISNLSRHITEYAHNPSQIKDLTDDLMLMSELIID